MESDPGHLYSVYNQFFSKEVAVFTIILNFLFLGLYAITLGFEAAFHSMPSGIDQRLQKEQSMSHRLIMRFIDDQDYLSSLLLVLRFGFIIIISFLSFFPFFAFASHLTNPMLGLPIAIFVLIVFFILAEAIITRTASFANSYGYLTVFVFPIYFLSFPFYPLVYLLIRIRSLAFDRIIQSKYTFSLDELEEMIDSKSIESKDKKLFKGLVNFGDTAAKEVMKSRVDVVAVDIKFDFDKVAQIVLDSGYSRLPVYSDTFDNIIGILYSKDLWPFLYKNSANKNWNKLVRPAFFVPESKKIKDLLNDFQKSKNHMAIINDEYGGTYGIVTLEDVLEEIVGEIKDESDEEEFHYSKIDDANYLFEGKILLNDVVKILELPDDIFDEVDGDSESLGGLILDLTGEMPRKGEIITYKNFIFKIESVDNRRIKEIKVTIHSNDSSDE